MGNLAINLIILITVLLAGVPVPLAFAAAVIHMVLVMGISPSFLLPIGYVKLNSVTILSVLFFIILGGVMTTGGLSRRLLGFTEIFVGRMKCGLGVISIVTCAMFGAISGTASSAVAAIGTVMIPRMVDAGYPRGYAASVCACSAILGQLIPPSVPMILFAWVTGQSITACFLSTVGPGILLVMVYSFLNWLMVRRMPNITVAKPFPSFRKRVDAAIINTREASFSLLLPVIVLGTIYGGIATPTEAAAIALLYCIVVGFLIHRDVDPKRFMEIISEGMTTTGVVILMLYFVMILSRLYTIERVPHMISSFLLGITNNKIIILLMVNVFMLIVGMLMDDVSGTVLSAPLLMPIMSQLGIHPLHFAAIVGTNLGLGNLTPPVAPILYLGGRVGNVSFDKMILPSSIFMIFGALPVAIITTYWADLALFLPRLLLGIK